MKDTDRIESRDRKHKGHFTGGGRPCTMESCGGVKLAVRWEDGKLTYPCSEGMRWDDKRKAFVIL